VPKLSQSLVNYSENKPEGGCRVWIIDDDEQGRISLADVIEGWGYMPVAAAGSKSLLNDERVSSITPHTLLVDYRLKGSESGLSAIKEIRDFFSDNELPAIIVTGDTAPDRFKELQSNGIHVLHKPVAAGRLRTLLSTLVNKKASLLEYSNTQSTDSGHET
jgi:DNA-binding NtrC family response regulator